ncbi:hypothetical protein ACPEEZ_01300 [Frigoribacterium sp. 2-23]|uniref:hypothetical protein n=1 Tax=Frigoribacterium sp. 2-23 TaxID=3415006 RepID=UPI003C6F69EB
MTNAHDALAARPVDEHAYVEEARRWSGWRRTVTNLAVIVIGGTLFWWAVDAADIPFWVALPVLVGVFVAADYVAGRLRRRRSR